MRALAREFAALLYDAGFTTVAPADSYRTLEERLLAGEADVAWGPPLVCARIEAAGGAVALRSVRWGAATYRAVLVCRSDDRLDLGAASSSRRRPRAVWVDPHSMGGYVLPRAHLRALGLEPERWLVAESCAGSYARCLEDVLEGAADLTSAFASSASAARAVDGYVDLCGDRAEDLRPLAYTAECPNDGVVLSPRLIPATAHAVTTALRCLVHDPAALALVARLFDVDGFDEPPPGTYRALLGMAAPAR